MPYRIEFAKQVAIDDPDQYINDCCIGGDVVINRLLPSIRGQYTAVRAHQEDWGWFVWFEQDTVKLSVDVHTEDANTGHFIVLLTSRVPKRFFGSRVEDTPELEVVKSMVMESLQAWPVQALKLEHEASEAAAE